MTTTQQQQEAHPADVAHAALSRCRTLVEPALRAAVDRLPEQIQQVAGYHLGWLDERGNPVQGDRGKAMRPGLVLLSAHAVGGDPATAVPAAVAVELVHNFSLLHDDVMDGDVTRRHRPTAWTVFGSATAILAGDALLSLASDVLAASQHRESATANRMLNGAVLSLIDGQTEDIGFEQRGDVGPDECQRMARNKTGALLGTACALGALYGGGSPEQVTRMRGYGEHLGLAFQHVDDLLGIWGDPAVTGKPVFNDLRTRKKTLPVVSALTSSTPEGHQLAKLYQRDRSLNDAELSRAAELVTEAGGQAWSRHQATTLLAAALNDLRQVGPAHEAGEQLRAVAQLITQRDR